MSIPSLGRCLIGVDVAMFLVAQALVVSPPATADEIDELLGTGDTDAVLDALGRLSALGLVIVEDGVAAPVGALADLLDRPLGLGPSFVAGATDLAPGVLDELAVTLGAGGAPTPAATARAVARRLRMPGGLERLLATAPAATAEVLDALTAERSSAVDLPVGHRYQSLDDGDPIGWLLRRGLLTPYDDLLAEPVRELVIANHTEAGLAPLAAVRPIEVRPVSGVTAEAVVAAGADRATRTLEAAEALLRLIGDGEIAVRKAGGVGVRELRRVAKALELEPADVGRLLELLDHAQLVNLVAGRLVATDRAERWSQLPRGRRWLVLVRTWQGADGFLSVAMSEEYDGTPLPALGDVTPVADAAAGRAAVLHLLAALDGGEAYDPDQFAEAVVWHRPNLWGPGDPPPERLVAWTLAEAELLGLVAMAAPTPIVADLLDGDDQALEAAAAATLGADQQQFLLQSDLTAMALGPLDPAVAARLGELADRQSDAATPLFRFTEASVRRGFDRGWTAESITGFLEGHALSGLPQPLTYLLADVERRYGSVRIVGGSSVVVTDDEALAVEIATTRRAARLGLRLVAPTVLVGPVDPPQLLDELRAEGFFPVLDGDVARIRRADEGDGPTSVESADAEPDLLPADWTGPSLVAAALAGEVADVVAALFDGEDDGPAAVADGAGNGSDPVASGDHRLHLLWNRAAVVTHLSDGTLREARGVLVAVDDAITLLNEDGIERLPLAAVVAVDDPSR